MFPLLLALAGAYTYGKHKQKNKQNNTVSTTNTTEANSASDKMQNIYNYYTNESENGNTLFDSKKKTKRTLFGEEAV